MSAHDALRAGGEKKPWKLLKIALVVWLGIVFAVMLFLIFGPD
jgi:hypothetical protein